TLTNLSTSYHLVNQQILNHLRPTRHVRSKFLANSHRIKYATEQYQLGQISIWQFLLRCSYTNAAYELRQRTWALRMNDADVDAESDHNVPADAVLVPDHIPNVIDPQPMENNNLQLDLNQPFNDAPGSPPIMNPPDLPDVPQSPDNRNLCMTCSVVSLAESEQQYIVLPCGHAWVCDVCVRQLEQQNSVCPMCRAENVIFQRVFFS
ncbi:RING-type domain-containing protein, partial [Aphis craccivora]